MKRYYCPHCGKRSIRLLQKSNPGATSIVSLTGFHYKCSKCGERLYLRTHWTVFTSFIVWAAALILAVVFRSHALYIVFFIVYILYQISRVLFTGFIRSDGIRITGRKYICAFDASPRIKFPRLFFLGNSVLEIAVDNKRYPVNVDLVETDLLAFSFLEDNDMRLYGKTVIFFDGEKEVGRGEIKEY